MRTFTNKPGTVFDATKTTVLYAEDLNEFKTNITNNAADIATKANDNNVVHKTTNETIEGIKTFGTNAQISAPRINVFGYSNTIPLQEWGDDSGQVGSFMRRLENNVMQFVAKNFAGYPHEFLGLFTFKNGLKVEGLITGDTIIRSRATAGSYVSLDGINIGMASSDNRSFGVTVNSGSMSLTGIVRTSDQNNNFSQVKIENFTATTTFQRFNSNVNLGGIGNMQEIIIYSEALNKMYRVTCMVWSSYNDNFIIIERIF